MAKCRKCSIDLDSEQKRVTILELGMVPRQDMVRTRDKPASGETLTRVAVCLREREEAAAIFQNKWHSKPRVITFVIHGRNCYTEPTEVRDILHAGFSQPRSPPTLRIMLVDP